MSRFLFLRKSWKVLFAAAALADLAFVTYQVQKAKGNVGGPDTSQTCQLAASTNSTLRHGMMEWAATRRSSAFFWISPLFCALCLVEALLRAAEARKAFLDNRALDELEKSLMRVAHHSSAKFAVLFGGGKEKENNGLSAFRRISKVSRSLIPAVATVLFWMFILPTDVADFREYCGQGSLGDSAVATKWLVEMSLSIAESIASFRELLGSFFWNRILPYRIHTAPLRFMQRLQVILRFIRFARFAGPLARMGLKLQDQIWAMVKARRQSRKSDMEKQLRLKRPSLIFDDIKHLESLAKVQTALASLPSHIALLASDLSSPVVERLKKKQMFGKIISRQLSNLQKDYLDYYCTYDSSGGFEDIYQRIVKMTQEITVLLNKEKRLFSNRYLMSPRAFLSSRRYLISPQTRFSLAWRMTVTNCLMIEIFRLCLSWHLSGGTFSISLSQIAGRLLVECKAPEQTKRHVKFITAQINMFRQRLFDVFPIVGPRPVDIAVCIPSGPQALLILQFGRMVEIFVDTIVFLDIFVWFFTGDIDIDTHVIIPKPFISRCIIPGTLVQILDHPTLPDLLPGLIKSTLATSAFIGHSRCLRWTLAMAPALKILLFDPLQAYFFQHIDKDEGLMHYAESVGLLTPERRGRFFSESDEPFRKDNRRTYLSRLSSEAFNASQIGLSLDATPESSHNDLQSLLASDVSTSDGTEKSDTRFPSHGHFTFESSPLKSRKSVHFGLDGDSHKIEEIVNDDECSSTDRSTISRTVSSVLLTPS